MRSGKNDLTRDRETERERARTTVYLVSLQSRARPVSIFIFSFLSLSSVKLFHVLRTRTHAKKKQAPATRDDSHNFLFAACCSLPVRMRWNILIYREHNERKIARVGRTSSRNLYSETIYFIAFDREKLWASGADTTIQKINTKRNVRARVRLPFNWMAENEMNLAWSRAPHCNLLAAFL